ncbi:hypothetical protein J5N97_016224 [Dioscorea zingiberensis]|uniref:Uncharacterized protein n=1 Tax=Dioscorea zingiberensis TaxID=325984 RepID=A0A9D5CJX8_9LILI|nr:hypothetical protein J5N97_016224 [Dioscorea zingiberensis]
MEAPARAEAVVGKVSAAAVGGEEVVVMGVMAAEGERRVIAAERRGTWLGIVISVVVEVEVEVEAAAAGGMEAAAVVGVAEVVVVVVVEGAILAGRWGTLRGSAPTPKTILLKWM